MVVGTVNDEEVQCPLCLRYHNIQRKTDNEDEEEHKPSIGEVFAGTVKVMGAAGAVAVLLSRKEISKQLQQAESLSSGLSLNSLKIPRACDYSPNFEKIAMGAMILTGLVCTVWSWAYKQKLRRQREQEFRQTLEICKDCWAGIREVLLNGDRELTQNE